MCLRRSLLLIYVVARRYALLAVVGIWMTVLVIRHMQCAFPRADRMDLSHLIGSSLLTVQGQVCSGPTMRWHQTRFLVEGKAIPLTGFHGRVEVTVPGEWDELSPGDEVRVRGWPSHPKRAATAQAFDEESFWASQDVYTLLKAWTPDACEMIRPAGVFSLRRRAWQFHEAFRAYWEDQLSPTEASLLLGMTLGARGNLDARLKNDCIRAGVYHIVVVSGQNMSFIIAAAVMALGALRIHRRWAFYFCAVPVVFYALAVGAGPPVVRAAVMALVGLGSAALRRDIPKLYPLAWAIAWVLWTEPQAIFGASFQLSFGATASLLLLWPERFRGRDKNVKDWMMEASLAALIVHLGIWPILVNDFHRLSLMGFVANWTIFPLSGLVMASGLLIGSWGLLAAGTVPPCGLWTVHALVHGTLFLIRQMARCSVAVVTVAPVTRNVEVVYYSALFAILFLLYRRKNHAERTLPVSTRRNRL